MQKRSTRRGKAAAPVIDEISSKSAPSKTSLWNDAAAVTEPEPVPVNAEAEKWLDHMERLRLGTDPNYLLQLEALQVQLKDELEKAKEMRKLRLRNVDHAYECDKQSCHDTFKDKKELLKEKLMEEFQKRHKQATQPKTGRAPSERQQQKQQLRGKSKRIESKKENSKKSSASKQPKRKWGLSKDEINTDLSFLRDQISSEEGRKKKKKKKK